MLDKRKESRWGEGLGCMREGVGYCGSVWERMRAVSGSVLSAAVFIVTRLYPLNKKTRMLLNM